MTAEQPVIQAARKYATCEVAEFSSENRAHMSWHIDEKLYSAFLAGALWGVKEATHRAEVCCEPFASAEQPEVRASLEAGFRIAKRLIIQEISSLSGEGLS